MAEHTNITWCDHTHNQWIGCARVSPACDGCYAAHQMDERFHRVVWGAPGRGEGTRDLTSESNRAQPFKWNRKAQRDGTHPLVFGGSLNDPFDASVPPEWRRDYFRDVIDKTPNLLWLLLTKRPQNIVPMSEVAGGLPANVALGTTAETQEYWDRNVSRLIFAKINLKPRFVFVSIEPVLGRINPTLTSISGPLRNIAGSMQCFNPLHSEQSWDYRVDWIITGGETDQGKRRARPSNPQWFREIRDACAETGTPYHHKQNGEYVSVSEIEGKGEHFRFPDGRTVRRVGKESAGRTIDGHIYDARPEVRAA